MGEDETLRLRVVQPLAEMVAETQRLIVEHGETEAEPQAVALADKRGDGVEQALALAVTCRVALFEPLAHEDALPVLQDVSEADTQLELEMDALEDTEAHAVPVPERHREGDPLPQLLAVVLPLRETETVKVPVTVALEDRLRVVQAELVGVEDTLRLTMVL